MGSEEYGKQHARTKEDTIILRLVLPSFLPMFPLCLCVSVVFLICKTVTSIVDHARKIILKRVDYLIGIVVK